MAALELTPGQSLRVQEARREYEVHRDLDAAALTVSELEAVFDPPGILDRVISVLAQAPGSPFRPVSPD